MQMTKDTRKLARKFNNIRILPSGYQLTFKGQDANGSWNDEKTIHGHSENSLRSMLEVRQNYYQKRGVAGSRYLIKEASGSVREMLDHNGDGIPEHPAFRITIRNLITGKSASKIFRVSMFSSELKAKREAKRFLKANNLFYNQVVQTYNELITKDTMRVAKEESATLKPLMHIFDGKTQKQDRWRLALRLNGVIALTDPKIPPEKIRA